VPVLFSTEKLFSAEQNKNREGVMKLDELKGAAESVLLSGQRRRGRAYRAQGRESLCQKDVSQNHLHLKVEWRKPARS